MTDLLDRLVGPATELLDRVDAALAVHGLPAGHPIVGRLRRLGVLPADAFRAIVDRDPAPLRAAASELRRTAGRYQQQRELLAGPTSWVGAAGERFAAQRAALAGQLDDADDDSLVGRLRATAGYLDDVAGWTDRSRADMARSVAEALGSAEAVRLRAPSDRGAAAATIGLRILDAAADAYDAGRSLSTRWAGQLDELPGRVADDRFSGSWWDSAAVDG